MIYVKLMGGMGNQMFQYALGRLLSLQFDQEIRLDLSFLKNKSQHENFVYRDYDLAIFNIEGETVESVPNGKLTILREPPHGYLIPDIVSKARPYIKSGFDILLDGYFQKDEYIEEIRSQLKKDFSLKKPLSPHSQSLAERIRATQSVCLNVRRADYVDNPNSSSFHGFHGTEYISAALPSFDNLKDLSFYVFSDDMEWCRENIKLDHPTFYVDHYHKGESFGEYLELMKACKHFLIPNSTFAWWAAWLSPNEKKVVTIPRQWFLGDTASIIGLKPSEWIEIDY
jgi:hypothetical protein